MSKSNTVHDFTLAMSAITSNLESLSPDVSQAIRSLWESQGCLGLIRGCQAVLKVFPDPNELEALSSIIAHAERLERMIDQDIRSLGNGGANVCT